MKPEIHLFGHHHVDPMIQEVSGSQDGMFGWARPPSCQKAK